MFYYNFGKSQNKTTKKKVNVWKVSTSFDFRRSNEKTNEKSPTQKQLNIYMKKDNRYVEFINDVFIYGEYNKPPVIVSFKDKLTFLLDPFALTFDNFTVFPTKKSVIDYLKQYSYADGLWEGMPGTPGVYPDINNDELGVIGLKNIVVTSTKV